MTTSCCATTTPETARGSLVTAGLLSYGIALRWSGYLLDLGSFLSSPPPSFLLPRPVSSAASAESLICAVALLGSGVLPGRGRSERALVAPLQTPAYPGWKPKHTCCLLRYLAYWAKHAVPNGLTSRDCMCEKGLLVKCLDFAVIVELCS